MSGPYIGFRVNKASRAILTETITFEPAPMVTFTNPFEWQVSCDSADKVVIRALEDGKRSLAVIAIAKLRADQLEDRSQVDPVLPSKAQWAWLQDVVFPMRERAYENRQPDAFDAAELPAPAARSEITPDALWQMAAGAVPARPPPRPPPARAAPQGAPLWGPVGAEAIVAAKARYLELVFDHANVVVVAGSVRYVRDRSLRPTGRYQMKVAWEGDGQVSIQVASDDGLIVIALARWRDSGLLDRQQQGGEPDDFQWIALEDALRAELAHAP